LKHFKKYFKGWDSNMYGHNKKKKKELKEELTNIEALEEDSDLSPKLNLRKITINVQLFNLYAEEELMWYQKSHKNGFWKGISILAIFIEWPMVGKGKTLCFI
jgi:hypothetical protein